MVKKLKSVSSFFMPPAGAAGAVGSAMSFSSRLLTDDSAPRSGGRHGGRGHSGGERRTTGRGTEEYACANIERPNRVHAQPAFWRRAAKCENELM